MRARRGETAGEDAAGSLGLNWSTFYKIERGKHEPSVDTARILARWLGWTVDQVIDAHRSPPPKE